VAVFSHRAQRGPLRTAAAGE